MLLRNSISNTKNFFRKTIENLRSFLSKTGPYQRLQTNSIDKLYAEFTHQWDSQKGTRKKKKTGADHDKQKTGDCATKRSPEIIYPGKNNGAVKTNKMTRHYSGLCSRSSREKRVRLIAQKLKDLEIIDKGNVELSLDVEEFLHYYSQLTYPFYLDIVDKFINQILAEFLGPQETTLLVRNSSPKPFPLGKM